MEAETELYCVDVSGGLSSRLGNCCWWSKGRTDAYMNRWSDWWLDRGSLEWRLSPLVLLNEAHIIALWLVYFMTIAALWHSQQDCFCSHACMVVCKQLRLNEREREREINREKLSNTLHIDTYNTYLYILHKYLLTLMHKSLKLCSFKYLEMRKIKTKLTQKLQTPRNHVKFTHLSSFRSRQIFGALVGHFC